MDPYNPNNKIYLFYFADGRLEKITKKMLNASKRFNSLMHLTFHYLGNIGT